MRRILLILAVLLILPIVGLMVLWGFVSDGLAPTLTALPAPVTAAEKHAECLRLDKSPPDYVMLDGNEFRAQLKRWSDICKDAHAADVSDVGVTLSLGRVMMSRGERADALPLFKALAAQDNVAALKEIFEFYKSWDRDLSRPRLVTRAEAEAALRRAAELGDADAILTLTVRLDRGTLVRRNPKEARLWAARGVANPPKDWGLGFMQFLQARLLATSEKDEERARGRLMLEELSRLGRSDARAELAKAIRKDDPMRARKLLDEALSGAAGAAVPALADMLIKGEGGLPDAERAVHLLKTRATDVPAVRAALGQLMLEGKYVPRDVNEGTQRIATGAQFDYDLKIQAAHLFAANPDVRYSNASGFLFDLAEFADLGEPGAFEALVALKQSPHPQFADKSGACALIEAAQKRGDLSLGSAADACRAT